MEDEDEGDSFEPKSSEVKEEEDDPTPLFLPSIFSPNKLFSNFLSYQSYISTK